jgi:peptide/nickel transport system permease protein
MAAQDANRRKLASAQTTKQDQAANVPATLQGSSPITSVPGSLSANDEVQPIADSRSRAPSAAEHAAPNRLRLTAPGWLLVLWSNKKARVGLIILLLMVLVAILAPVLAPYDPRDTSFMGSLQPSAEHWLGTTQAGQDVFSQLIWGARTSLIVGVLGGGLATIISLVVGMTAGYLQGIVDDTLSFFINLAMVIPTLPLMISLAAYAPVRGLSLTILVIGITGWAWGARMKRAQVISLRAREYITSARFAGEKPARIIFREVLPNMTSFVAMSFIGAANGAIGGEAGLAFLGLGDPATISWGSMLYWANVNSAMLMGQYAWLIAPGVMLSLITLSLTLINFGVDAISNPRLREE